MEIYIWTRRYLIQGVELEMCTIIPVTFSISLTVNDLRLLWKGLSRRRVSAMKVGGTPTSRQRVSRSCPKSLFTNETTIPVILSNEIGSCLLDKSDWPSRIKIASNAGRNGLLDVVPVMLVYLCIEGVVDKQVLGSWDRVPICVEDALSLGTRLGLDELHIPISQCLVPLEFIEVLPVLGSETRIVKELLSQDFNEPPDWFPILG